MRRAPLVALALLACAVAAQAVPVDRVAIAAKIRKEQALGRIIMDPRGRFLLYEWQRPYNWSPDATGLARTASMRPQTTLYRVLIPDDWRWINEPVTEPLFPMLPGATYWLGNLSPDGEWISVYQLDRDDKVMKAGVAATRHEVTVDDPPKIVWFDIAPDDVRFDRPPAWSADGKRLVYPVKGGLARADPATGKAILCVKCEMGTVPVSPVVTDKFDSVGMPVDTRLVATSADGVVGAFVRNDAKHLALYIRSMRATVPEDFGRRLTQGRTLLIFENDRLR